MKQIIVENKIEHVEAGDEEDEILEIGDNDEFSISADIDTFDGEDIGLPDNVPFDPADSDFTEVHAIHLACGMTVYTVGKYIGGNRIVIYA